MTANVFSLHTAQPALQRGFIALSKVCFPSLLSSSYPSCRSMRHCAFRFGWEMFFAIDVSRISICCWKPFFVPYQSRFRTSLIIQSFFFLVFKHFLESSLVILWKKCMRNPEITRWFGQDLTHEGGINGLLSKVSAVSHPEAGLKRGDAPCGATIWRQSWGWGCTGPK